MNVLTSNSDGVLIVIPQKRLDTNNAVEVEQVIVSKINEGENKIVLDFSHTEYVASSGLRIILKIAKMLKKNNGAMALCSANEQIYEVLDISGFLPIFEYCPTLEKAIAVVKSKAK